MNIFLAGNIALDCPQEFIDYHSPFVLQTFWDLHSKPDTRIREIMNNVGTLFLDSGAFTFMNSGKKVDWPQYLDLYADFINRHQIEHFFELDLDTVIGGQLTQEMTKCLEAKTGKQCIPVFHACRGLARWRQMAQEYPYVAIGASALTAECRWVQNDELLRKMVDIAHQYGAKVHGLGYTRLSNLNDTKIPFDSVDSSACLSGGRFGTVYKFTGSKLISRSIKGRSKGYKQLNDHNIREWIKMQYYKTEDL